MRKLAWVGLCAALTVGVGAVSPPVEATPADWTPTRVPTSASTLNDVDCEDATYCVGVGQVTTAGAQPDTFVTRWSGSTWQRDNRLTRNRVTLTDVDCVTRRVCLIVALDYAVGESRTASMGTD